MERMNKGRSQSQVDHPAHYTAHGSGVECKDVVMMMPMGLASPMKYIWRNGLKTESGDSSADAAVRDLMKARKWLEFHKEFVAEFFGAGDASREAVEGMDEMADRVLCASDGWSRPVFNAVRMLFDEFRAEMDAVIVQRRSSAWISEREAKLDRIMAELDREIERLKASGCGSAKVQGA